MNALRTLSTGAPVRRAYRAAIGVLALGLLTLTVAILGTMALGACGGSADTASSAATSEPTQTAVTAPTEPPAVSRWQPGTDDLAQTRAVARAYLRTFMDKTEMAAKADRLYAADATLDNWIARKHVDGVDAIKEVWEEWQQDWGWPANPDRFVTRVAPGAVVYTVSNWWGAYAYEIPYIDFLAVSDGKVVQDEVYGDPHVTEIATAGVPDGAETWPPRPGAKDTEERSAAVALKFSEIISQTGDYAALRKLYELYARDVVALDTSQRRPLRGVDAVIAWHKRTTKIPGADSLTVEPPIAGRGWAALRVTVNGISSAGTGHMPGAILLDIRNGKIVRVVHYYNSTVLDLSP